MKPTAVINPNTRVLVATIEGDKSGVVDKVEPYPSGLWYTVILDEDRAPHYYQSGLVRKHHS